MILRCLFDEFAQGLFCFVLVSFFVSIPEVFVWDFLLFECFFCDSMNGVIDVLPVLVECFDLPMLVEMVGDVFGDGSLPLAPFVRFDIGKVKDFASFSL